MAGIVLITGANASHFLMACMLLRSLRRWAPGLPVYVLDFGLSDPQRYFLRQRGALLDRPARFPAGLHPFHYKAAMGEYLASIDWRTMAWLDSDMIAVGPVEQQIGVLAQQMQAVGDEVAVCRDTIGSIANFLSIGFDVQPFTERMRSDGIDPQAAYYNTGIVVCSAPNFLRDWTNLVEGIESHMLVEQNGFNLLIHRRPPPRVLDAQVWNLHGMALEQAVVDESGVRMPGHDDALLLHPTSPSIEHIAIREVVVVGRERIACQIRQCRNPELWHLQITQLREFLYDAWDEISALGLAIEINPRGRAPAAMSPAAAFLLADAIRLQQAGRWNDAHQQFTKLDQFGATSSPDLLALQALALFRQQRWPEATEFAQRALALAPPHGRANLVLGMASAAIGQHQIAIDALGRAAGADPGAAAPHVYRAQVLMTLGRLEDALSAASTATDLAPDLFGAWRQLAKVLSAKGRETEADAARGRAIALVGTA